MVLHGSLLGTLAFVGFSNDTCARLLEQIPLLVAVVVLPLAAAMVVFP